MGGPWPAMTPFISAPAPSTLNGLKPGKKRVELAPTCACTRPRLAVTVPAISAVTPLRTSRRLTSRVSLPPGQRSEQGLDMPPSLKIADLEAVYFIEGMVILDLGRV